MQPAIWGILSISLAISDAPYSNYVSTVVFVNVYT